MCGLVGLITKHNNGFSNDQTKAFEQMLFVDTLRGDDSTGVFTVNNANVLQLAKQAAPGPVFLQSEAFTAIKSRLNMTGRIAIGHNRSATIGSVSNENAHPFTDKHIALVHNGTITNKAELAKDTTVDSEAICKSIAAIGAKQTLEKIEGAFALIWYDLDTQTLHIARNDERPLWMLESSSEYVFMSELGMLTMIYDRTLTPSYNQSTFNKPIVNAIKVGVLYSFKNGTIAEEAFSPKKPGAVPAGRQMVTTTQQGRTTRGSSSKKSAYRGIFVGDQVVFDADSYEEKNGRYQLLGTAGIPGKVKIEAVCWLPTGTPKHVVTGYIKRGKAIAKCLSVYLPDKKKDPPFMFLDAQTLQFPVNYVTDFENNSFITAEAGHICDNVLCSVCTSSIDIKDFPYTRVEEATRKDSEDYEFEVTCKHCIGKELGDEAYRSSSVH